MERKGVYPLFIEGECIIYKMQMANSVFVDKLIDF